MGMMTAAWSDAVLAAVAVVMSIAPMWLHRRRGTVEWKDLCYSTGFALIALACVVLLLRHAHEMAHIRHALLYGAVAIAAPGVVLLLTAAGAEIRKGRSEGVRQ